MNDADIENEPAGPRLDSWIAEKVFGMVPCDGYRESGSFSAWATAWSCPHMEVTPRVQCFPVNKEALDHPHSLMPKYSTNIAAAWQVLEKLAKENFGVVDVVSMPSPPHPAGTWRVFINHNDQDSDGEALTAPLAICRAALKAVS